ncbi:MAG: hypothetical protein R2784_07060 [Saprospiraceae bacterium]
MTKQSILLINTSKVSEMNFPYDYNTMLLINVYAGGCKRQSENSFEEIGHRSSRLP